MTISLTKRTRLLLHNVLLNRKYGAEKEIIEKLNAINAQETPEEDADNTIRELMKEWNTIGHVPFKEKISYTNNITQ